MKKSSKKINGTVINEKLLLCINILCITLVLWIVFCLFFLSDTGYACNNRKYIPHNIIMFLIIGILISAMIFFKKRFDISLNQTSFGSFVNKYFFFILGIGTLLLFAFQIYVSQHIYFYTGWDVWGLTDTALSAEWNDGLNVNWEIYTYKRYPNNVMLTLVFIVIKDICRIFSFDPYFGFIIGSCISITLACMFTALCVNKLTGNKNIALVIWLLSLVLCGSSPWMTIPYSDSYGILFPIIALFFYLSLKTCKTLLSRIMFGAAFGFFAAFGYLIKPSAIIILIAVIIVEAFGFVFHKENRKKLLISAAAIIVASVTVLGCNALIQEHFGLRNSDEKFSMTHWFMMGLKEETNGVISGEDVHFSASIKDPDERTKTEIKVAIERIKEKGAWGMVKHTARKTLTNFNDGRLGWGFEGPFYRILMPEKNAMSTFLRNIFYDTGEYFVVANSLSHFVWLLCWVLVLVVLFWKKKGESRNIDPKYSILFLALVGHILFVMLFEARARYSFIYSPLLLTTASLALHKISQLKPNKTLKKQEGDNDAT